MTVKFITVKGSALANALGVETKCAVDFSDLQNVKAHLESALPAGHKEDWGSLLTRLEQPNCDKAEDPLLAAKINWREWLENSDDDDSFPGKRYWY